MTQKLIIEKLTSFIKENEYIDELETLLLSHNEPINIINNGYNYVISVPINYESFNQYILTTPVPIIDSRTGTLRDLRGGNCFYFADIKKLIKFINSHEIIDYEKEKYCTVKAMSKKKDKNNNNSNEMNTIKINDIFNILLNNSSVKSESINNNSNNNSNNISNDIPILKKSIGSLTDVLVKKQVSSDNEISNKFIENCNSEDEYIEIMYRCGTYERIHIFYEYNIVNDFKNNFKFLKNGFWMQQNKEELYKMIYFLNGTIHRTLSSKDYPNGQIIYDPINGNFSNVGVFKKIYEYDCDLWKYIKLCKY